MANRRGNEFGAAFQESFGTGMVVGQRSMEGKREAELKKRQLEMAEEELFLKRYEMFNENTLSETLSNITKDYDTFDEAKSAMEPEMDLLVTKYKHLFDNDEDKTKQYILNNVQTDYRQREDGWSMGDMWTGAKDFLMGLGDLDKEEAMGSSHITGASPTSGSEVIESLKNVATSDNPEQLGENLAGLIKNRARSMGIGNELDILSKPSNVIRGFINEKTEDMENEKIRSYIRAAGKLMFPSVKELTNDAAKTVKGVIGGLSKGMFK